MIEHNKFFEEIIVKAQQKVKDRYDPVDEKRKWESAKVRSYENKSYDVEIRVLKGSPCKGYVVANHGTKVVRAYSVNDKLIGTWNLTAEILKENKN